MIQEYYGATLRLLKITLRLHQSYFKTAPKLIEDYKITSGLLQDYFQTNSIQLSLNSISTQTLSLALLSPSLYKIILGKSLLFNGFKFQIS